MDREGKLKLGEDCFRESTIDLCWLENWPLTCVQGPPEIDFDTGLPVPGASPVRFKISIRGGWRWITHYEKTILEMGGVIARLMLPEPRLLPMDSVKWDPIREGEVYPLIRKVGKDD
jgi:hypothetical protein